MMELKPCSKCGSNEWGVWICIAPDDTVSGCYVECEDCLHKTEFYHTEKEAIEAWNRRSDND